MRSSAVSAQEILFELAWPCDEKLTGPLCQVSFKRQA